MTPRERVLTTIHHQVTDRLPRGELLVEEAFLDQLYPGEPNVPYSAKMRRLVEEIDLDLVTVRFDGENGEVGLEDLGKWTAENRRFVMALVDGLFWKPGDPLSFNEFILGVSRGEERVRDLIRIKKMKALTIIRRCLDAGADGIIIGDDLAYDQGPFISPKNLRKWIFPGLKEMVNAVKSGKRVAFLHSCGNLTGIMEQILSIGFDGLHGLAPSSGNNPLTIRQMTSKNLTGKRLTLMGMFELDSLQAQEIKAMKEKILPYLTKERGYILGSAAGLSMNTPLDSFRALYS